MQKGFFSDAPHHAHAHDAEAPLHAMAAITWPEITGVSLLTLVSLVVGLYPRILLDSIEPAVKALLAGGGQ
jgi:NADH-quinone oxidoreductase subunit M